MLKALVGRDHLVLYNFQYDNLDNLLVKITLYLQVPAVNKHLFAQVLRN